MAVGDVFAGGEGEGMSLGIDRRDFGAQQQLDLLLGPELGRADIESLEGLFAREIFLDSGGRS
jgi:hypothetical protein